MDCETTRSLRKWLQKSDSRMPLPEILNLIVLVPDADRAARIGDRYVDCAVVFALAGKF